MELTAEDGDTTVSFRGYEDDKFYLGSSTDADKKVLLANADVEDATINFLSFDAAPTLNSTATIRFYGAPLNDDDQSFIYANKDGKLTKTAAKYDEDEGCYILKTRTLGSYVMSDKPLVSTAAAETPDNPDTGANDVVGIATALAAVALVSAAAVSLKK